MQINLNKTKFMAINGDDSDWCALRCGLIEIDHILYLLVTDSYIFDMCMNLSLVNTNVDSVLDSPVLSSPKLYTANAKKHLLTKLIGFSGGKYRYALRFKKRSVDACFKDVSRTSKSPIRVRRVTLTVWKVWKSWVSAIKCLIGVCVSTANDNRELLIVAW